MAAGSVATAASKSVACAGSAGAYTCVLSGVNSNLIQNGVAATVNLTLASTASGSISVGLTNVQAVSATGYPITTTGTGGTITVTAATVTPSSLGCSPVTVSPGGTSACTVTLTSAAPTGGSVVSLTSSNTSAFSVPASVTVAAGATSGSFSATAAASTTTQSSTITASLNGTAKTVSLTVQPSTSPSGLVSGYSFSEGSGTTTADSSGNGNTGTLKGATWTTSGKYGNALSFNGTSNYVDLGNSTSLQLTGSMTLSAWIYAKGNPSDDAQIVAKSDSTTGWQLKTSADTGVRTFGITISNGSTHIQRYSKTVLALNTWYYVTGVYNATAKTLDIYVNGVLDDGVLSGTVPSAQTNATQNALIGMRPGGYYFNGTIDEVRIYNTALAQAAIQSDMGSVVGVPLLTSLQCSPTTLGSGAKSTCTAGLSMASPTGGTVVTLSSNSASLTVPASVTVAAGAATASFSRYRRDVDHQPERLRHGQAGHGLSFRRPDPASSGAIERHDVLADDVAFRAAEHLHGQFEPGGAIRRNRGCSVRQQPPFDDAEFGNGAGRSHLRELFGDCRHSQQPLVGKCHRHVRHEFLPGFAEPAAGHAVKRADLLAHDPGFRGHIGLHRHFDPSGVERRHGSDAEQQQLHGAQHTRLGDGCVRRHLGYVFRDCAHDHDGAIRDGDRDAVDQFFCRYAERTGSGSADGVDLFAHHTIQCGDFHLYGHAEPSRSLGRHDGFSVGQQHLTDCSGIGQRSQRQHVSQFFSHGRDDFDDPDSLGHGHPEHEFVFGLSLAATVYPARRFNRGLFV